VAIAILEGVGDSLADLTRLRFPSSKTDGGDLSASVEREVGRRSHCVECYNRYNRAKGVDRMERSNNG
jgi:hypothetical protein